MPNKYRELGELGANTIPMWIVTPHFFLDVGWSTAVDSEKLAVNVARTFHKHGGKHVAAGKGETHGSVFMRGRFSKAADAMAAANAVSQIQRMGRFTMKVIAQPSGDTVWSNV